MNKIDLGQVISILANIGVILGIVFLGIQIRQTNRAVAGAAYQARSLAIMERQDWLAESSNLASITLKVEVEGLNSLTELEKSRLDATALGQFYRIDGTYYQCELGLLDREYCGAVFDAEMRLWVPRWRDQGILQLQRQRGFIRPSFDLEIAKYVDGELDVRTKQRA